MLLVCFHTLTACVAKSIQRPRLFPAFSRRLDGLSYTRGTRPLSQYFRLSRPCCRRSGADIPQFSRGVSLRGVEYLNKMVMLDVVIIGGGPHALTLASLLSNPGHDLSLSRTCGAPTSPAPTLDSSNTKRSSRRKKRRKALAGASAEEQRVKPAISEGVVGSPLSLRVVDSYGEWTTLWESQFAALNIPHLRSHTLVHTDPFNKEALQEFVSKHDRSREVHSLPDQVYILDENAFFNDTRLGKKERRRLNITSTLRKSLSFSLPGTKLSVDFFKDQVKRYKLDEVLIKGTVEQIIPVMDEKTDRIMRQRTEDKAMTVTESINERSMKKVDYFRVKLRDGTVLKASRVVMATGPTRAQMANIPSWVKSIGENFPEERLQHTVQLMHRRPTAQHIAEDLACQGQKDAKEWCVVHEAGQRVMVVGGGLTSAHIISIALKQGASHVTWVMRKHLQLKQFDAGDVETLVGRYSHVEHGIKMDGQAYLRQFYNERSLHKRLAMIHQARKGGAVTPEAYVHLQPCIQQGQVDVKTYCQVREASWCYRSQAWSVALSNEEHWHGDMIWLATGCKLDVKQDPLLSEVMKEFPIQVIDGWPCISEDLQWAEQCPLYLMGQYTALQIGPHAVNLAGGQAASMRIAKDIRGRRDQDVLKVSELSGEKSKTEEYVQQMKGLLWL